jgi:hypothetical protein
VRRRAGEQPAPAAAIRLCAQSKPGREWKHRTRAGRTRRQLKQCKADDNPWQPPSPRGRAWQPDWRADRMMQRGNARSGTGGGTSTPVSVRTKLRAAARTIGDAREEACPSCCLGTASLHPYRENDRRTSGWGNQGGGPGPGDCKGRSGHEHNEKTVEPQVSFARFERRIRRFRRSTWLTGTVRGARPRTLWMRPGAGVAATSIFRARDTPNPPANRPNVQVHPGTSTVSGRE